MKYFPDFIESIDADEYMLSRFYVEQSVDSDVLREVNKDVFLTSLALLNLYQKWIDEND